MDYTRTIIRHLKALKLVKSFYSLKDLNPCNNGTVYNKIILNLASRHCLFNLAYRDFVAVIVIYSELEVCLCLLKLGHLVMRIYRPYLTIQTGNVYLRLDAAYEKKFGYFSMFLQQIIDGTAEQSCGRGVGSGSVTI